eukprot:CAMPEP_0115829304 /NCGR_PEP_ID=MMETSP0287-20121206/1029_1 /TAXON_ID=412157 /ORGANISM="Chrysochromulina rotalis, Strain UIO044" /LENGTH=352 /DNA_ID=CAMNT_0003282565 /DNA_START=27 /DNA_END=1084 /DNA_ORIENTATION=-
MAADVKSLDSVDGMPAYEIYIRDNGLNQHPITSTLVPLFARLTSFARTSYSQVCATCHLCSVLLRRYKQDERVRVQSHFDRNSIVTAVASLNGGLEPSAFKGGFFLQRNERPSSREFLATRRTEAIFHSYDLNHGVELLRGTRYSAVFWFSDSTASCHDGTSPWYQQSADNGSMDAALAELHQLGSSGYPRNATKAAEYYQLAAEQGSAASQSKLGRMLLAGEGVPQDKEAGLRWVERSAAQGHAPAEYTMGIACQNGDAIGGLKAAASWFLRAAEAGISAAQYELGVAYINGDGVQAGMEAVGAGWLQKAATAGHKEAIADLLTLREDPAWRQVEQQLSGMNAGSLSKDEV